MSRSTKAFQQDAGRPARGRSAPDGPGRRRAPGQPRSVGQEGAAALAEREARRGRGRPHKGPRDQSRTTPSAITSAPISACSRARSRRPDAVPQGGGPLRSGGQAHARRDLSQHLRLRDEAQSPDRCPCGRRAGASNAIRTTFSSASSIDKIFGDENPNLPATAARSTSIQPTRKANRQAWDQAMAKMESSRLGDVLRGFEELAKADPEDAAALAQSRADPGLARKSSVGTRGVERYVSVQTDEKLAAEAWAIAEVLRCGQGMEDQADYVEHSMTAQVRDPHAFVDTLSKMEKERVVAGLHVDQQQGILAGLVLEPAPVALTPELQAKQAQPLGAFFMLFGNMIRLWNTQLDRVEAPSNRSRARQPPRSARSCPCAAPPSSRTCWRQPWWCRRRMIRRRTTQSSAKASRSSSRKRGFIGRSNRWGTSPSGCGRQPPASQEAGRCHSLP